MFGLLVALAKAAKVLGGHDLIRFACSLVPGVGGSNKLDCSPKVMVVNGDWRASLADGENER